MSEIMSLDDAIASEPPRPRRGPACWAQTIRASLGEKSWPRVATLLEEVRMGDRTAASVARILTKAGHKLSGNAVNHHLRGDCACNPDD